MNEERKIILQNETGALIEKGDQWDQSNMWSSSKRRRTEIIGSLLPDYVPRE